LIRALDAYERQLLDRLIARVKDGEDVYADQLSTCKARSLDSNGSLELVVLSDRRADSLRRLLVEGEAVDSDGIAIHYLIHAVDGRLAILDIYKDDVSSIVDRPPIEQIEVQYY
jgi:hypothetical protein